MASAEPRPSASVILVRDSARGLQTFMVRRHARSPVAPSAYVFPGGTVRGDDRHLTMEPGDSQRLSLALSDRADTPLPPPQAAAIFVCALRELFEEAGVLLVRDSTGRVLEVDAGNVALQERLESTRLSLQAHDLSLASALADLNARPAFELLVPFSHWVTPAVLAARFDTRFFVAEMPPHQAALHDTIETSAGLWLSPARALEGDYHVVYATAQHLRRIAPFASVHALLTFARQKQIQRLSPEVVEAGSGIEVFIRPEQIDAW